MPPNRSRNPATCRLLIRYCPSQGSHRVTPYANLRLLAVGILHLPSSNGRAGYILWSLGFSDKLGHCSVDGRVSQQDLFHGQLHAVVAWDPLRPISALVSGRFCGLSLFGSDLWMNRHSMKSAHLPV